MDDWQNLIVRELEAVNRKLEKIDERMNKELDPIKRHVTQVRLFGSLLIIVLPVITGTIGYFI